MKLQGIRNFSTGSTHKLKFKNIKKPILNNQIRAKEVRIIGEKGEQMGVLALGDALKLARERGLELIQVTEKVDPPVCKIMDYGKFFYQQKKKDKSQKNKGGEMKGIRLSLGISEHDMEVKANQTHKFLDEGDKIRVEMILRGREKALQGFAREKFKKFVDILNKTSAIKTEREIKREPRGLSMIISKEAIKK